MSEETRRYHVLIHVSGHTPICPACGHPTLYLTLAAEAIGAQPTVFNTAAPNHDHPAPNQSKVFIDWETCSLHLQPHLIECTSCLFRAPYDSIMFTGLAGGGDDA
jgi:hypothetical protein